MKQKCINAVSQVLGRALTKAEADTITADISRALRQLSRQDPQGFAAKSSAQRLQEAAVLAGQSVIQAAKLKQQRAALQIQAHQRIQDYINDRAAEGMAPLDAVERLIAFDADMRSKVVSLESYAEGVNADLQRQLIETWTSTNPKKFGLLENEKGIRSLIMEIRGQSSGDPAAKAGAKAWKQVTEAARERFNRAGGDIGKLDDWGFPQHHSQRLVAKAGRDAWVRDTMPLLDRSNYFNPDGSRMTDADLRAFLESSYETIATGGANKLVPGQFKGTGARANRGSASRQIHFKDADSFLKYQDKYGDRSLYEVLTGHIEGIAKDITLIERFGPNPDATFRYFRDKAAKEQKQADPTKLDAIEKQTIRAENLYNVVTGKTLPVASQRLAASFDTLRNWLVASRLGSAVITSFSDEGTLRLVARTNNLPQMQLIKNQLSTLNIANRMEERVANRAGLGLRVYQATLNRFGTDSLRSTVSRKLASFVIRAQGLTAITEARRRAFSVTMMGATGGVVRDHASLSRLDPNDNRALLSKGIDEETFQVWKRAKQEDWGNGNDTMLTPESIYRIPDAEIDPIIASRVKALRDQSQAQIDELSARDVQDQQWIGARQQKLRTWVTDQQAKLAARIGKVEGKAKDDLLDLQRDLAALNDRIDSAQSAFASAKAGPLDITSLRETGAAEGKVRVRIREQEGSLKKISREALAVRDGLDAEFRERFGKLQDELDSRVESGRLDEESISHLYGKFDREFAAANARLTERISKSEAKEAAALKEGKDKIDDLQSRIAVAKGKWAAARKAADTVRAQGVKEGRSIEASKGLRAEVREVGRKVESLKKELTSDFVDQWGERRAEFMEFATRAAERATRRAQVSARIARDIDPKIQVERIRAREQAATKLLGIILEESDMAVIQPGVRERALMQEGLQRGTWKGELTKSFFLFKSFPLAMISRHVRRGWLSDTAPASRATYLAGLIASTTALGALSLQVNEVLSGRDPRNMDPTESLGRRGWLAAMLKGGAMGLYGEFLFGESTRYGQTPLASLLGPVYGLGESALQLTQGNAIQAIQGKETDFGAEATRMVKSNLPGANLWYTKAALDHMIFHQLQEFFSPGYLRKMRTRQRKDFGQQFYWEPGELTPERAPNLSAVAGE